MEKQKGWACLTCRSSLNLKIGFIFLQDAGAGPEGTHSEELDAGVPDIAMVTPEERGEESLEEGNRRLREQAVDGLHERIAAAFGNKLNSRDRDQITKAFYETAADPFKDSDIYQRALGNIFKETARTAVQLGVEIDTDKIAGEGPGGSKEWRDTLWKELQLAKGAKKIDHSAFVGLTLRHGADESARDIKRAAQEPDLALIYLNSILPYDAENPDAFGRESTKQRLAEQNTTPQERAVLLANLENALVMQERELNPKYDETVFEGLGLTPDEINDIKIAARRSETALAYLNTICPPDSDNPDKFGRGAAEKIMTDTEATPQYRAVVLANIQSLIKAAQEEITPIIDASIFEKLGLNAAVIQDIKLAARFTSTAAQYLDTICPPDPDNSDKFGRQSVAEIVKNPEASPQVRASALANLASELQKEGQLPAETTRESAVPLVAERRERSDGERRIANVSLKYIEAHPEMDFASILGLDPKKAKPKALNAAVAKLQSELRARMNSRSVEPPAKLKDKKLGDATVASLETYDPDQYGLLIGEKPMKPSSKAVAARRDSERPAEKAEAAPSILHTLDLDHVWRATEPLTSINGRMRIGANELVHVEGVATEGKTVTVTRFNGDRGEFVVSTGRLVRGSETGQMRFAESYVTELAKRLPDSKVVIEYHNGNKQELVARKAAVIARTKDPEIVRYQLA